MSEKVSNYSHLPRVDGFVPEFAGDLCTQTVRWWQVGCAKNVRRPVGNAPLTLRDTLAAISFKDLKSCSRLKTFSTP